MMDVNRFPNNEHDAFVSDGPSNECYVTNIGTACTLTMSIEWV